MDKLQIGKVIFKLKKEKGITQDQLGNFIGVSTAAVSKWEGGNSYPDITLLPLLASFFNVSTDELLDYKIELSEEEVMKIFKECEVLFAGKDLQSGIDRARAYVEKYKSSYYLKLRIGFLFNMYSWRSDNEKKAVEMVDYAVELFEDIEKNCSNREVTEQALYLLGAIYSSKDENDRAVEVLNKIHKSEYNIDFMLANIYIERGDIKKGRKILQSQLWKNIFETSAVFMCLSKSYFKGEKDFGMVEKYCNLSVNIKKLLSPEADSVLGLEIEYMNFAQAYLMSGQKEKALSMLKKWVKYIEVNDINNPKDFSSIWCFNELSARKPAFTLNMYENMGKILEDDIFDSIRQSDPFKTILNKVKNMGKNPCDNL